MTDQNKNGRAVSLVSVILIVLLTMVSMLSAVIAVEYFHARSAETKPVSADKTPKVEKVSMDTQYEVAIHESGHAVLGRLFIPDRPIEKIWLYTERPAETYYLGMTEPGDPASAYPADVWARSIAVFFLGGLASEEVFFSKKPPDEYEDKDVAGEEMLEYCEKVGCECPAASKFGEQCLLKDMMRAERERLYGVAVGCLSANKETVVALANQLYRKAPETIPSTLALGGFVGGSWRKLDAQELKTFFATHPLAACPK